MGKTIRNLVLTLGDVAIPVALVATATDSDEKLFRVLHNDAECLAPVSLRVYCPADERILEDAETVKAWQVAPGQYLPLSRDEVDELTPVDSAIVPITGFAPAGELDQLLVRKRYHLAPTKAFTGRPAYKALAEAMRAEDVVALTRFHAWNSEQLAAISSRGEVLELATLHLADDVALEQADEIAEQIAEAPLGPVAADLMRGIVARYTRPLQHDDLASVHRAHVRALLERKLAGEPILTPDEPAAVPPVPVADLETALRRTLKAAPRKPRKRKTVNA